MEMPAEIRRAMAAHASSRLPDEACGLLAADTSGRLCMAYCLSNASPSPTTFTLDAGEHFRALRHAEARGWHLAGIFHSHPGGAACPSPTDVAQALEPDWLYVVVGLESPSAPEVRAFWIRGGGIEEEALSEAAGAVAEVRR
ncbi:MAG: M67 family metallopeptidase [Actinomycetota bacterium]